MEIHYKISYIYNIHEETIYFLLNQAIFFEYFELDKKIDTPHPFVQGKFVSFGGL